MRSIVKMLRISVNLGFSVGWFGHIGGGLDDEVEEGEADVFAGGFAG